MKGYIKLMALKSISESKQGCTGYDLIKSISEKCGYKPSAGSIYPILKELADDGLVSVRHSGAKKYKKYYSATSKGMQRIEEIAQQKNYFVDRMKKNINYASSIIGMEEHADIIEMLDRIKKGDKPPFGELTQDLITVRKEMFALLFKKDLSKEQRRKISRLLQTTAKQMRAIGRRST